jgi:hypothetical protein
MLGSFEPPQVSPVQAFAGAPPLCDELDDDRLELELDELLLNASLLLELEDDDGNWKMTTNLDYLTRMTSYC